MPETATQRPHTGSLSYASGNRHAGAHGRGADGRTGATDAKRPAQTRHSRERSHPIPHRRDTNSGPGHRLGHPRAADRPETPARGMCNDCTSPCNPHKNPASVGG